MGVRKQSRQSACKMPESKGIINVALAGNANVGKSVIFSQLTGVSQTIGNWPGKTVEKKEGSLSYKGYTFNIVDLPGIYSLSTYTLEEIVSRQFIVSEDVDIIINVIDATNLERNLFFTFQLLELQVPMILAINQMDILRRRHMSIDFEKLREILGLSIFPVVAVHGRGVIAMIDKIVSIAEGAGGSESGFQENGAIQLDGEGSSIKENFDFPDLSQLLSYGKEVERRVREIERTIQNDLKELGELAYPSRFTAIKLLEGDEEFLGILRNAGKEGILRKVDEIREELENIHGEDISTIISSEIYNKIHKIVEKVLETAANVKKKATVSDMLDHLTTHSVWGYIILGLVLVGTYFFTFFVGDFLGGLLDTAFNTWSSTVYAIWGSDSTLVLILWDGAMGGFIGAVGGVLVYVIPFFLIIEILQDSGYLPRAAFLLDRFMHVLGVHGKAIIPMILGFGCNVPACAGCRIMESHREKKIALALSSLVPCAAVLVVVMGLVGRYLGAGWIIFLFGVNFGVIIFVGRLLNRLMPGSCTELIMEMHEYRKPNTKVVLKQAWVRTKEFVFKSIPMIVIIGVFLEVMLIFDLLEPFNIILSPITVYWLGLPIITGVFLLYGILRKELTLVLLELLLGASLVSVISPLQMIVFCLVTMLYIPCFATIVVIAKEAGWKYATKLALLEIGIALLIGGAVNWVGMLFVG
ncbi:ferrous iron transport protein B [Candidatus Bathyarchaeota archaeon]|nr:ferrous iron transport protein B [Candidatus Bathyarchaeota archaeon]